MKCPQCSEEMVKGYVWLRCSHPSLLEWSEEEPDLSIWKSHKGEESLMKFHILFRDNNLKQAYRCVNCEVLTVTGIGAI